MSGSQLPPSDRKNPWAYLPREESNDDQLDWLSISSILQSLILDKLENYQEQGNMEETCRLMRDEMTKLGYFYRAARVGIDEETEEIIGLGAVHEDLSAFTDRNVQVFADELDLSYSNPLEMMAAARLEQIIGKIEENGLTARRLIIRVPVCDASLSRLLTSTRPESLLLHHPVSPTFIQNGYVCGQVKTLYVDEQVPVSEEDILRLTASQFTIGNGYLTANGLLRLVTEFLLSHRDIDMIRIEHADRRRLSPSDFSNCFKLLQEDGHSVRFLTEARVLISRPNDQKELQIALNGSCLTFSQIWMIFS